MTKGVLLLLKLSILLVATGVLIWLLWFPSLEGRAASLDLLSIYTDPLIIYGYIATIPFFLGVYNVFMLLGHMERKTVSSKAAQARVRNIQYCAITFSVFIILGILYIRLFVRGDDPAGVTALSMLSLIATSTVALSAHAFEKRLRKKHKK